MAPSTREIISTKRPRNNTDKEERHQPRITKDKERQKETDRDKQIPRVTKQTTQTTKNDHNRAEHTTNREKQGDRHHARMHRCLDTVV